MLTDERLGRSDPVPFLDKLATSAVSKDDSDKAIAARVCKPDALPQCMNKNASITVCVNPRTFLRLCWC